MKTIVQYDDIREFELKPSEMLSTYLDLTEKDSRTFFPEGELAACDCPACLSTEKSVAFIKFGLQYCECTRCRTLYVSPRPAESAIETYYRKSDAYRFWNEQFLTETEAKRREKLFKPRVQWIIETVEEYSPSTRRFASVNSIHPHFLQELIGSSYFDQVDVVNPRPDLGQVDYKRPGVRLVEAPLEELGEPVGSVALFEAVDRLSNVIGFFAALERSLVPGGLCFVTTISISGFDLQMLWDKSNSIFPPDRLNAFSIEGMLGLFERHGFECIELSTPGVLDVQIVANACREDPLIELPRFVRYLLEKRDSNAHESFQEFLQMNRLSSFVRAVFRKQ